MRSFRIGLSYPPGSEFHYSTYGYVLLGQVIEKISGLTYTDYLQKNIWDKAAMTETGISTRMNL
ncbi:MAG: beta-lactamase family protein [Saprospiraceae bacterium]|nr:beta-lactamase family protein [Saprospiraceae bacterium]